MTTTPPTVVLEQTGEQHTVRRTFTVTGAPDVDTNHGTLTPTELEVTFRQTHDGQQESDVTLHFSNVPGHFPTRTYRAITERWKPRPDWINPALTPHAPDWWRP